MCIIWFERTQQHREASAVSGTMKTSAVRIGIAGCGMAARIHLDRLLALEGVAIVGCADPDLAAAEALADRAGLRVAAGGGTPVPAFSDHRELLRRAAPDALAIFSPHLSHYRQSMDALQAGLPRVHRETPLDEPARGGRYCQPGPRTRPEGWSRPSISPLPQPDRGPRPDRPGNDRPATAGDLHSRPALVDHARRRGEDLGDRAPSWSRGESSPMPAIISSTPCSGRRDRSPSEVGAIQSQTGPGIDLVTAAAIRLADGTPASLAISGISPGAIFALDYFGELGRLHVTDQTLEEELIDTPRRDIALPLASQTIDGNFVAALTNGSPLCCPADQALDTVRLLEAIARSAATGQIVRLI